jgi:hypothetical protein
MGVRTDTASYVDNETLSQLSPGEVKGVSGTRGFATTHHRQSKVLQLWAAHQAWLVSSNVPDRQVRNTGIARAIRYDLVGWQLLRHPLPKRLVGAHGVVESSLIDFVRVALGT